MTMTYHSKINHEETKLEDDIMDYFYNNKDNRTKVIAAHFNISFTKVDKIINKKLSRKNKSKKSVK